MRYFNKAVMTHDSFLGEMDHLHMLGFMEPSYV